MHLEERLSQLEKQVESLLGAIKGLRKEIRASAPSPEPGPGEGMQAALASLSSYVALAPQMKEDALLNTILRCAMHVVRAGGAGLTLLDRSKGKLVFKAAIGDGAEGVIGYEVPLEGSQHGLAFATGEVQSSTPIHAEIEAAAKAAFRNVLVAPLLVEGEPVGTMSAVNKQDADRFSPRDMEAYKYFADLAALVVRQRLREGILKRVLGGDRGEVPPELEGVTFDKDDVALMSVVEDIGKLAQERKDVVPLLKQLMGVLLQMSKRLAWR
jgi:hypothetical protein